MTNARPRILLVSDRVRIGGAVLAVALAVLAPRLAHAQAAAAPKNGAAQELKLTGDAAVDARDYETAAKAYEEAYATTKDPSLLYNQGRAYQAMSRFPEALDRVERFSSEASPTLKSRVPRLSDLIAELRGKVATIDLTSNVEGARVIVGRRVLGETGKTTTFRVNAGKAHVEIAKEGFLPYTNDLDLPGGSSTVLDVKLVAKSEGGILVVRSNVSGAAVSVDGKASGQTPSELVVPIGPHRITLSHAGYDPVTTSTLVEAGQRKDVSITLEQKPSLVTRWWFWTGVAAVTVAAVIVVVAVTSESDAPSGTLPPGRASAPLITF